MTTAPVSRRSSAFTRAAGGASPLLNTRRTLEAQAPAAEERVKAQLYVNFGYMTTVPSREDPSVAEDIFIGLPYGLPLDTMNEASTNSRDDRMRKIIGAKNGWLANLVQAGNDLEPGEAIVLMSDEENGMAVELRRRGEDTPLPSDPNTNEFARTFNFKPASE